MKRPRASHSYFEILEALPGKGCALCGLEIIAVKRWFESFLYEHVNDPGIRSELSQSRGYCPRHAHQLLEMQDALGLTILYKDQVGALLGFLEGKEDPPRRWPFSGPSEPRFKPGVPCPACKEQHSVRRRYAAAAALGFGDEAFRLAFDSSPGFCAPHIGSVLSALEDKEPRRFFVASEKRKLEGIREELSEFIRKSDHEARHEAFGSEKDGWERAVRLLTGERGVF
ncbi:MAG: hypothetical protein IT186_05235 [Acidobacteria bacterium]|nr:hypothetical protein [Acidobacteriota bacterium]MCG3194767.1 hypothetical protein [Thermoanaerobaculia bacterium]MCK6684791.1 DUF6062 family protein [Thermoanaerobaculia bacterium]